MSIDEGLISPIGEKVSVFFVCTIEGLRFSRSLNLDFIKLSDVRWFEPRREKTGFLPMRKQRRRSALR